MGTAEGTSREDPTVLLRVGTEALRTGRLADALAAADEARAAAVARDDPSAAAQADAQRGLALALLGDFAAARPLFERALAAVAADPEATSRILLDYADAAFAAGDGDRAHKAWERARAHFESYWDGVALARICAGLAVVGAARPGAAHATMTPRFLAARALEEAQSSDDALAIGRACLAHAVVLAVTDVGSGTPWATRAARIFEANGLQRELAEACLRWGGLAEDSAEAASWLRRAEDAFSSLGTERDVERARVVRRRRERAAPGRGDARSALAEVLSGLEAHLGRAMLPLEVARAALRLAGADRAIVALARKDGALELAGAVHMPEDDHVWRGPVTEVTRLGGGPTLYADLRAVACPLVYGGRRLGAIYCDRMTPGAGDSELELVTLLATVAAVALAARANGVEIGRVRGQRDAILVAANDGVVVVAEDGMLETWNGLAAQLLGLDPSASPPGTTVATWPSLAALAVGRDGERRGVLLPGGAARARAQAGAGEGGEPGGAVILLERLGQPADRRVRLGQVVGTGPVMRRRLRSAEAAARAQSPVLLSGEPGTGRRFLARAIAGESQEAPAIVVDCRTVPDGRGLVGIGVRPGLVDDVGSVPLILTDVDALAADACLRLLEALGEPGAPRVFVTSQRPVAELLRPLSRAARERLAALTIELPPLHERLEDMPYLVESILEGEATRLGRPIPTTSPELMAALAKHGWPGHVAELVDVLRTELERADPEADILFELPQALFSPPSSSASSGKSIADAERRLLVSALKQHRGNVPRVARTLGVSKGTVYNMMRKYRVDPTTFRASS